VVCDLAGGFEHVPLVSPIFHTSTNSSKAIPSPNSPGQPPGQPQPAANA
jgi:hypothetical protein